LNLVFKRSIFQSDYQNNQNEYEVDQKLFRKYHHVMFCNSRHTFGSLAEKTLQWKVWIIYYIIY